MNEMLFKNLSYSPLNQNENETNEYYVMVHIDAGETISVKNGDQVQNIKGPATVRMISTSGPPLPMQLQVPPGHLIQQIVDENGILTHLIISPYNPNMQLKLNDRLYFTEENESQNNEELTLNTNIEMGPKSTSQNGNHVYDYNGFDDENGPYYHTNSSGRLRNGKSRHSAHSDLFNSDQNPKSSLPVNKRRKNLTRGPRPKNPSHNSNNFQDTNGDRYSDSEIKAIKEILSNMPVPQVSEITAKTALVTIYAPSNLLVDVCNGREVDGESQSQLKPWTIDTSLLSFKLFLAERDSEPGSFLEVYTFVLLVHFLILLFRGQSMLISLKDLRPSMNYFIKAQCVFNRNIHGTETVPCNFFTLAAPPGAPKLPILTGQAKNSLTIKWTPPIDNGSRITEYIVQHSLAASANRVWIEGYRGNLKTCKLKELNPASNYVVRIAAVNSLGQSPWSEEFKASTAGSPPTAPESIRLVKAMTHALQICWTAVEPVQQKLLSDSHHGKAEPLLYRLEMLDEVLSPLDENFVTVYSGKSCEHLVTNLRRSTCYKFRVAVANSDGLSKFSDVIACQTLADKPSQAKNLQATALDSQTKHLRQSMGSVSVCWDQPDDSGGQNITCYCLEMLLPVYRTRGFKLKKSKVEHLSAENLSLWPSVSCETQPVYFASKSQDSTLPLLGRFLEAATVSRPNMKPKRTHSLSPSSSRSSSHSVKSLSGSSGTSSDHESSFSCKKSKHNNRMLAEYSAFEDPEPEKQTTEPVWCVVYLGLGTQVIVEGLKSGLELAFRVRATNESLSKDFVALLQEPIWGKVSSQLIWQLAPVVPGPFIACPRLSVEGKEIDELGTFHMRTARDKQKSEVWLHWSPPQEDGGAPIIQYEVQHATSGDWTGKKSPQGQSSGSSSQLSSPEHRSNLGKKKKHVPEDQLALAYRGTELECPVSFQESASIPRASSKHGVFPLRPGRTHAFRVRAKNSLGWTNWSEWREFTASASPPSRPSTAPRCRAKNVGQIIVSWDDVEKNNGASVYEYRLEWAHVPSPEPCSPISRQRSRECEEDFEFNLLYAGPQLSHDLFHVPPACSFRFRVCAINAAGMSDWSPLGKYVTAPAAPAAPDRLSYVLSPLSPPCGGPCCPAKTVPSSSDPITVHEALLKWARPLTNGSPIMAYRIELTRLSQETDQPASAKSRSTTITSDQVETFEVSASDADSLHDQNSERHFLCHFLDNLSALTIYKVRVQAKNAIGWGDFSGSLRFTTHPPLPPAQPVLNVLRIGDKTLRLQWSLSGDNGQHLETQLHMAYEYILYMRPLGQTCWTECHRGLGSRSFKVTGLSEASVYSFYVRAQFTSPCKSNTVFNSLTSTSKVIHVQTSKPVPEQCKAPKLVKITAKNCTLEWTPISPLQDGDEIIYSLQLLSVATALPTGLSNTESPETGSSLGQLSLVPVLGKHPVEIYRGPNTNFSEEGLLEPGQSYVVRVCAIRLWKTPIIHLQSLLFAAAQNQYDVQEDPEADDEDDEPSQHSDSSDKTVRLPIKINDVVTQYQKNQINSKLDCEERVGAYSAGLYFCTPLQGETVSVEPKRPQSEAGSFGPLTPAVTMQLFSSTYSVEPPVINSACTSTTEQGLFTSAWNLVGTIKKKPKQTSTKKLTPMGSGSGGGVLGKFLGILRHPNDRQWALVIVVAFTLVSILTAWLLAYLIGEDNGHRHDSGRGNCRAGHKSTYSTGCTTD